MQGTWVCPWIWKTPWRREQYSCLENAVDIGAWWATVHGVTETWTQLSTQTWLDWVHLNSPVSSPRLVSLTESQLQNTFCCYVTQTQIPGIRVGPIFWGSGIILSTHLQWSF